MDNGCCAMVDNGGMCDATWTMGAICDEQRKTVIGDGRMGDEHWCSVMRECAIGYGR